MGLLHGLPNRLVVQVFKHAPWLASRWARRHRFVEGIGIPWTPMRKSLTGSTIALVTTFGATAPGTSTAPINRSAYLAARSIE